MGQSHGHEQLELALAQEMQRLEQVMRQGGMGVAMDGGSDRRVETITTQADVQAYVQQRNHGVHHFVPTNCGRGYAVTFPLSTPAAKSEALGAGGAVPLICVGTIPCGAVLHADGHVTILLSPPANPYDPSAYGPMHFQFRTPAGTEVGSINVVAVPEDTYLPPTAYEFHNSVTNLPVMETGHALFKDLSTNHCWEAKTHIGQLLVHLPRHVKGVISRAIACVVVFPNHRTEYHGFVDYDGVKSHQHHKKCFLSPPLSDDQMRFVLHWQAHPSDLDLHMQNDLGEHCYFGSRQVGGMSLDVDVRDGHGPETITVMDKPGVTYFVGVHHFGGEGCWGRSNAHITAHNVILFGEKLRTMKIYVTPNGYASDTGSVWQAFSFKDRVITLRNVLTPAQDFSWPVPVVMQGQPSMPMLGQQPMQGQPMMQGQPSMPMLGQQPMQGQPMMQGQPIAAQPGQWQGGQGGSYGQMGQQPMQGQPMMQGQPIAGQPGQWQGGQGGSYGQMGQPPAWDQPPQGGWQPPQGGQPQQAPPGSFPPQPQ